MSAQGDMVLITGASGFVGSAVARALASEGFSLRCLMRPTSPRLNIRGLEAEIVEGDMRDAAVVTKAAEGVRYVFHVAADYRLWALDPAEIVETNKEGTRCVMRAALQAGVERVVYTSSVATLAAGSNGSPADETLRLRPGDAIGAYKRSKLEAEAIVDAMVEAEDLPVVIVHPSTPIGPRDVRPTPTGRIIIEAAHGRMPVYVDTGLNLVHVDDVAAGHVSALHHGVIGEHYILGGQDVALATLLVDIAELLGHGPPKFGVPHSLIYPIAFCAETMARITKREPFVTFDGLRMAKRPMFFSSAKAERLLAYRPRPYREAVVDALDWFRGHGYVR